MSDSLRPHGLQLATLPFPLVSPRVCSNSCQLSWWCYLTITSSAISFSFCRQSFPASGSFPTRLFTSSGQSTGASASATALPMNIQGWFPLRLTGLSSLQPKELSRVFTSTTIRKHQFFTQRLGKILPPLQGLNRITMYLKHLNMKETLLLYVHICECKCQKKKSALEGSTQKW